MSADQSSILYTLITSKTLFVCFFDLRETEIFSFSMYDVDGSGFIELAEMMKLVKSIFQMMNQTNANRAHLNPAERARTIFRVMDKDGDGRVNREEFISTCLAEPKILSLLTPPGT